MAEVRFIPVSWRMRRGSRPKPRHILLAGGGRMELAVVRRESGYAMRIEDSLPHDPVINSEALDWLGFAVESIRAECDLDYE